MLENTESIDWFEGQNIIQQELFLKSLKIIIEHGYANASSALSQQFTIGQRPDSAMHLLESDIALYTPNYCDKDFMLKLSLYHLKRTCKQHLFYPLYEEKVSVQIRRHNFLGRFRDFLHHPLVPGFLAVLASAPDFAVTTQNYYKAWKDIFTKLIALLREPLLDDAPVENELNEIEAPKAALRFFMQFVGTFQFIYRLGSASEQFNYLELLYQDAECLYFYDETTKSPPREKEA